MSDATRRLADELTDDELDTLVEMVQARNEGRLTRREVVKSGGLLAALGLGGGAAVGSASADASTSDGDGNIGEPGNRVDAFLDGVDATSVDTGNVTINNRLNTTNALDWTTMTPMDNDHSDAVEAVVGKHIYIMGGREGSGAGILTNSAVNSRYDIYADEWDTMTAIPQAMRGAFGDTDGTYIFHMGGINSSNSTIATNRRYDVSADSWTQVTSLPTRLFNAQAVELDGTIYVFGGTQDPGDPERDQVYAYDISADNWSTKTSMPTARENPSTGTDGEYIYVAGGNIATGDPLAAMERYDPASDSWTTLADVPTGVTEAGNLVQLNNHMWLSNYWDDTNRFTTTYGYDIASDSWSEYRHAPDPARNAHSTVRARGHIYSIGGKETTDGNRTRKVEMATLVPSGP